MLLSNVFHPACRTAAAMKVGPAAPLCSVRPPRRAVPLYQAVLTSRAPVCRCSKLCSVDWC